jgi:hypothetical protein
MQLQVKDIKKGDVFDRPNGWEAIGDAKLDSNNHVQLDVRYTTDGGTGVRVWENPGHTLEIRRDPAPMID